jgi:hypothetical protein
VRQPAIELDERQQLAGALVDFFSRPAAQVERKADVLDAGERRQQVEELEDEADLVPPHSGQVIVGQVGEAFPVDADLTGGWPIESADEIQECGLAGAGRPDDGDHLAARDREGDGVEGDDVAFAGEPFGDGVEGDHRSHGRDYVNYFTILSNISEIEVFSTRPTERGLYASRAAEPDRHLIAVNNHRHRASALAEFEHAPQPSRILLDVDVLERDLPPLKVVTGGLRIGSGVFAEDEDHGPLSHRLR